MTNDPGDVAQALVPVAVVVVVLVGVAWRSKRNQRRRP
jgi:hypothetical protein